MSTSLKFVFLSANNCLRFKYYLNDVIMFDDTLPDFDSFLELFVNDLAKFDAVENTFDIITVSSYDFPKSNFESQLTTTFQLLNKTTSFTFYQCDYHLANSLRPEDFSLLNNLTEKKMLKLYVLKDVVNNLFRFKLFDGEKCEFYYNSNQNAQLDGIDLLDKLLDEYFKRFDLSNKNVSFVFYSNIYMYKERNDYYKHFQNYISSIFSNYIVSNEVLTSSVINPLFT